MLYDYKNYSILIFLRPGDDVLEIGFGQGYGIRLAAECVAPVTMNHWKSSRIKFILENAFSTSTIKSNTFKNDGHVYGVEISEYMLQKAKRWIKFINFYVYIIIEILHNQLVGIDTRYLSIH